jgi:hypothetical protein
LVEEVPGVTQFREVFGKQLVLNRYETRWRATARLEELAAARGVSLLDIGRHFVSVPELPKHPLVLKGTSTWLGGYKINGKRTKIVYTAEVKALEQAIIDLNAFIDKFTIVGGKHHGYIREFNCRDHPSFAWDLGGRLYSVGDESYQGLSADERKLMTIDGRPVIELDIRASALTIFHGQAGQALDFEANPDPYTLPELRDTPRDVVKNFITASAACRTPGRSGSLSAARRARPCGSTDPWGAMASLHSAQRRGPYRTHGGSSRPNRPWRPHVPEGVRGG